MTYSEMFRSATRNSLNRLHIIYELPKREPRRVPSLLKKKTNENVIPEFDVNQGQILRRLEVLRDRLGELTTKAIQEWCLLNEVDPIQAKSEKDLRHGVWVCSSCLEWNETFIIPGEHPLGFMTCNQCGEVWSPKSEAPAPVKIVRPPVKSDGVVWIFNMCNIDEPPFAYVCGSCGLTHRAKIEPGGSGGTKGTLGYPMGECMCGTTAGLKWADWTMFALPGASMEKPRPVKVLRGNGGERVVALNADAVYRMYRLPYLGGGVNKFEVSPGHVAEV